MSFELRAGRSIAEAVEHLSNRIQIEEVASLGSLLQQAEELGTSIVDSLRIYAEEMRDKRMRDAEEKAQALPVKMVFPLAVYIFPVMMIVVFLPIILRIKGAFH
jgi:tight adherence protein C